MSTAETAMERAERFLSEQLPAPHSIAELVLEVERAALERAANQVVAFLPGNPISKPIADLIRLQASE
jgi:Tfp pilus assembly protein PilO